MTPWTNQSNVFNKRVTYLAGGNLHVAFVVLDGPAKTCALPALKSAIRFDRRLHVSWDCGAPRRQRDHVAVKVADQASGWIARSLFGWPEFHG